MESIPNPIVLQRADPYVIRYGGEYFFTGSYPDYDRIILRRAQHLRDLQTACEVTVWEKHETGSMSHLIWAPELHRIAGAWYIYFGAAPDEDQSDGTFNHRIFCLENDSQDPTTGTWIERGRVDTGMDTFSLDATSFEHRGAQYLVWGQQDLGIPGNSNLYIARMRNPWTLDTAPVMLAKPEYDWECVRYKVCEGPAVISHGDRIYITYSASGTGPEYAMGMLGASVDSDLLSAGSWSKSPRPVFTTNAEEHMYGPGHNSFTTGEDGLRDIMVYHVRDYTTIVGDPLRDPNRQACAAPIAWTPDGPDFGRPHAMDRWTPTGTEILPPDGSHR